MADDSSLQMFRRGGTFVIRVEGRGTMTESPALDAHARSFLAQDATP